MGYLQVQIHKERSKTKNTELHASGQITELEHPKYDGQEQVNNNICFKQHNSENHGQMTMYTFNVKPIRFCAANKLCLKLMPTVKQPWVFVPYSY